MILIFHKISPPEHYSNNSFVKMFFHFIHKTVGNPGATWEEQTRFNDVRPQPSIVEIIQENGNEKHFMSFITQDNTLL